MTTNSHQHLQAKIFPASTCIDMSKALETHKLLQKRKKPKIKCVHTLTERHIHFFACGKQGMPREKDRPSHKLHKLSAIVSFCICILSILSIHSRGRFLAGVLWVAGWEEKLGVRKLLSLHKTSRTN